ncbi:helix-turn-helix domain-containing protein [Piscinibacter gummiphilus]|uniref:HTH cro/C1-type domain-containing protein n=1 Tax=Piscinibacter gummiphilus TaxID=946333 RepID=A0A1W6L3Z3_9BURK|nr:helix-turn-helix domain-containing protein [Piscinibacter gummiphilus]ARN19005.1 hypothetical protein A4W93_03205 [Piscinibacter gummiphilus]
MHHELAALMKTAREASQLSQMALALRLGVSQRHVNFIERGRSRPSRVLLLDWLTHTGRPASMFNPALRLAGFSALDGGDHVNPCTLPCDAAARRTIELHHPNPGLLFDADWHLVAANDAAGWVLPPAEDGAPLDLIAALTHREGWLARADDPVPVAGALLGQLRAEQWARPSLAPRVDAFEAAVVAAYGTGVRQAVRDPFSTVVEVTLRSEAGPLRFSAVQTWTGLPLDQDMAAVRAELWYPLDDATARAVRDRL